MGLKSLLLDIIYQHCVSPLRMLDLPNHNTGASRAQDHQGDLDEPSPSDQVVFTPDGSAPG